jgi:hypothetical protein
MDSTKKTAAKKDRGNLTEDGRTEHSEIDSVTKIKLPEQRKSEKKTDREEQKDRLNEQGRADKVWNSISWGVGDSDTMAKG